MSPLLIFLVLLGAASIIMAGASLASMLQRRELVLRAHGDEAVESPSVVLRPDQPHAGRLRARLEALAAERKENEELQHKLIQGGFESPSAPAIFFLVRVASVIAVPMLALLIAPRSQFVLFVGALAIAAFLGFIAPMAVLDRAVRLRQERVTHAVPDALDLLLICVEAGISLDAAILRVARDLRLAHPDLAHELMVVTRLTNAGIPREQALRGLWQRTGVLDLRSLVSSLIQSEKWGTSIATILRVSSEALRRRRRQLAERKAKMAPLKMTFPLLFFILPALFVVILGPAVAQIIKEFSKV